jgi:hypothetical protein
MDRVTMRVVRINEAHFAAPPLTTDSPRARPVTPPFRGCVGPRGPHKLFITAQRNRLQPEERSLNHMNHEMPV